MNTSVKQETAFNKMVGEELPTSFLQSTIDWISDNLNPDQVWHQADLNKFVGNVAQPEDVFKEEELKQWAIDHGFTPPATAPQLSYSAEELYEKPIFP